MITRSPFFLFVQRSNRDTIGDTFRRKHKVQLARCHLRLCLSRPIRWDIQTINREFLGPWRTHQVDQTATLARRDQLLDVFGDLLPVELSGGLYHIGTTSELFKLIGNKNLMYWCYDEPESIQYLMNYLYQDRLDYLMMIQNAGQLTSNIHSSFVASGSPGYTNSLPDPGESNTTTFDKVWAWSEAQETEGISPDLFKTLFLPTMAQLARQAGLVYYGCCERLDDRIDLILAAIPNIRAVSCSPWSQVDRLAEMLGSQFVLSKKPNASFISGSIEDVSAVAAEMKAVADAMKRHSCPVEVILRDLYDIQGDRDKLRRWVSTVRTVLED